MSSVWSPGVDFQRVEDVRQLFLLEFGIQRGADDPRPRSFAMKLRCSFDDASIRVIFLFLLISVVAFRIQRL